MVEINIYTKFNYKKVLRNANNLFGKGYSWYNPQTVFAEKNSDYSVSLWKGNVRICYWNEQTSQCSNSKALIKKFILDNFSNKTIGVKVEGDSDIFDNLQSIHTINLG